MVKNARTLTRKLGRTWSHRLAMFRNMATSLIEHERIKTTLPKAKELRRVMDRLVTKGKADTQHKRKQIASYVREQEAVDKLFAVLGPRYLSRPGGYTRVLRAGWRAGDNAPMAVIEFVDRPGELRPARPVPAAAVVDAAAALDADAQLGETADANQR